MFLLLGGGCAEEHGCTKRIGHDTCRRARRDRCWSRRGYIYLLEVQLARGTDQSNPSKYSSHFVIDIGSEKAILNITAPGTVPSDFLHAMSTILSFFGTTAAYCAAYPYQFPSLFLPVTGTLLDARHIVSLARASWGLNHDPEAEIPRSDERSQIPNAEKSATAPATTASPCRPPVLAIKHASNTAVRKDDHSAGETNKPFANTVEENSGAERNRIRRVVLETPKAGKPRDSTGQNEAYVSLHGLEFLLADLYMKTPQDILEKVSTRRLGTARI